jgi:hypothetical protein
MILELGYVRMMAPKKLTHEEFASLLKIGNSSVKNPPATIPVEHSAKLIALGYMVDFEGRLWMTTPGKHQIAVGLKQAAGRN